MKIKNNSYYLRCTKFELSVNFGSSYSYVKGRWDCWCIMHNRDMGDYYINNLFKIIKRK